MKTKLSYRDKDLMKLIAGCLFSLLNLHTSFPTPSCHVLDGTTSDNECTGRYLNASRNNVISAQSSLSDVYGVIISSNPNGSVISRVNIFIE